ncbi:hypothetical protein SAMN02745148_01333 [Modicisalibacter ilicicola DSM 19980]|uniref:Uncharacterized protein n=1 Tax=Modicisalibacter ilicicola DSM 19980 TaxID=1121942 RepID=A0A1M4X709_9GAMM|nr:hypothetical protein [Halomonas ilicicola]SHE88892.1 hypothetical protein SAMN02745148_01333 [Halomonas ilicicola DSM 19980]
MKVVHVKNETQRDACLARLCAEVYGHEAGIAPLATFAGTLSALMTQEAARVLALVDGESRPAALALLTLDEQGESMEVAMLTGLDDAQVTDPAQRLVKELALKAPLRVNAATAEQERMFRECGIERWFDGAEGVRIGVSHRHGATRLDELPPAMRFDERAVIQAFKQDKAIFDGYKQRFIRGLESFPAVL